MSTISTLTVCRVDPAATLPARASAGAAGYDLAASREVVIPARGRALVPTGLGLRLPEGCYGRLAPRSGLALKHGLDVGAGVVDADYRGEVGIVLFNHTDIPYTVHTGDRVAQLILEQIYTPPVTEVPYLDDATARGVGGFGSTGHR